MRVAQFLCVLIGALLACQPSGTRKSESGSTLVSGGEMFAAAEILYNGQSNPVTLEALRDHLKARLGGEFELTEWRGHNTVVPQLLVKGKRSWTLQIEDDPEYVPEQIAERADEAVGVLPDEEVAKLRQCTATLAAMGISEQASPREVDGQIVLVAGTTLDPNDPDVRRVLLAVADFVDGFVYDLTEAQWIQR
jgi:hypothetical protein